ncbi:prepilin-type N-terminal cleavage/methylation domain-containing protein [Photobacterium japonica]|uniref:type IV pilus modification PilV family protein n=1 Tax=Photobacterium japonica TaxID=2910235 RepID=UPI003D0B95B5
MTARFSPVPRSYASSRKIVSRITASRGFTLIESIVAIVILAIAMVTMTSFLFPQAERSVTPYYQARAAAIANAFLNEMLARQFDEFSDPYGDSRVRCGEVGQDDKIVTCSVPEANGVWPKDHAMEYFEYRDPNSNLPLGYGLVPSVANDVDDFHGCWGELSLCQQRDDATRYPWRGFIETLLDDHSGRLDDYKNMTVTVDVRYDTGLQPVNGQSAAQELEQALRHKRITVTVDTGRYGQYDVVAYRSNY